MNQDDLASILWLIEHADAELNSQQLPTDPLALVSYFRKRHDAERTRLLCELLELRTRAEAKFTLASKMFFTRRGYEQASSEIVANHKAKRFPKSDVADLCCGIGGDSIALAQHGCNLAIVDKSPSTLELAKANLQVHNASPSANLAEDVREIDFSRFEAWHLDPDRRVEDQRRSSPDHCEPPLSEFLAIDGLPASGAVKLSPAADAQHLLDSGVELEWIGSNRECQQQVAWFGSLAQSPSKRTATWITKDAIGGVEAHCLVEVPDCDVVEVEVQTPKYVYEPRAVVLAAGLEATLAEQHGLKCLATGIPYLCSDERIESRFLRRFETLAQMPFRKKSLLQQAKQRGLCIREVKKRGVDIVPSELLRELSSTDGDREAVVILFPKQQSVTALLARRDD